MEVSRKRSATRDTRRIIRKQIARALHALAGKRITDESVHAARKDLKRARASLRLLRDALGAETYTRENAALRDVARPLSRVRDSKVLIDTLAKLVDRFGPAARALDLTEFRGSLERERALVRRRILGRPHPLRPEREALQRIRERAAAWPLGQSGWPVLGAGLKRVYKSARRALAAVEAERTPEALHEWRKQTKYFWHELQLLRPLRPRLIGDLAKQAHALADCLGNDHDLAVLRERVVAAPARAFRDPRARRAVLAFVDRYRKELSDSAVRIGRHLYAQAPHAFAARCAGYWKNWRHKT